MKVPKVTRVPDGVEAGYGTYFGARPKLLFPHQGSLRVGRYSSVGAGFQAILGGNHRLDNVAQYPFGKKSPNESVSKGDIVIGNDCWIGYGCTVLSGVTIDDGAVVGAMSVVAKNVQPYEVVVGNPIRHLRYRFSEDQIAELLMIRWWDWDYEKIQTESHLLLSDNIDRFLEAHR